MSSLKETVLLIDGHSLAFRAFYALPELTAPDGTPTNMLHGFLSMLLKTQSTWNPDATIIVFDAPTETFRHVIYPDYKKGRKPTPEAYKTQIPILQELLKLMGYPLVIRDGVEADDVIASIACRAASEGDAALILSSDKDLFQVLREGVRFVRPIKGISAFQTYDETSFHDEYGFAPSSMPDYLALLGDSIDNVPGVPGIGEKNGRRLISEYETLENLYEHLESLKPAVRTKLAENRERAYSSRDLIRLRCGLSVEKGDLSAENANPSEAEKFCQRLGLQKIVGQLRGKGAPAAVEAIVEEAPVAFGPDEEASLEELLREDSLAVVSNCLSSREGEAKAVLVSSRDGRTWRGEALPPILAEWTPGRFIVTDDYKNILSHFGGTLRAPDDVFDLKTAHYLLHPDLASHEYHAVVSSADLPASAGGAPWALLDRLSAGLDGYMGLSDVMKRIDLPLLPVLVDMERYGIRADKEGLILLGNELEERIASIEKAVRAYAGTEINLNSPKQVATLLFETLSLPPLKETKTGLSTDVHVLEELAAMTTIDATVPKLLLEHREVTKLLTGFVVPLRCAAESGEGIIHGIFEAATTGTGRLSSREPNLQNLPAYGQWAAKLKTRLIPHENGRIFVSADYSQIELRVLAHLSGEERLKEAFAAGRDIHTETASLIWNMLPEMVSPELRRMAKMVNFGILYGMSAFGLASRLGISRPEASKIIERYFSALPRVQGYIEESVEEAGRRGYTRTYAGRIRPLAEVPAGSRDKGTIKRIAVNSPIQGTAADIARTAMIRFGERFPADGDIRLVLQVHDSLVCECPETNRDLVMSELVRIMEDAAILSVPLRAEPKSGDTFAAV